MSVEIGFCGKEVSDTGESQPLRKPHRLAVRQIVHQILKPATNEFCCLTRPHGPESPKSME